MEERITIVDENNNPIGDEMKSIVHRDGIWHRTVHVYYIRKNNHGYDFLVHLRSKDKTHCPNMWDTRFGGHVKNTQSILDALKDEMKEEIGVGIDESRLLEGPIRKVTSHHETNREFNYIFFYEGTESIDDLKFEDDEVQEVKWLSSDEVLESMADEPEKWTASQKGFRSIIETLQELKSKVD